LLDVGVLMVNECPENTVHENRESFTSINAGVLQKIFEFSKISRILCPAVLGARAEPHVVTSKNILGKRYHSRIVIWEKCVVKEFCGGGGNLLGFFQIFIDFLPWEV